MSRLRKEGRGEKTKEFIFDSLGNKKAREEEGGAGGKRLCFTLSGSQPREGGEKEAGLQTSPLPYARRGRAELLAREKKGVS